MEMMDHKTRRKYAIACFLPILAFLVPFVYYIVVISPLIAQQSLENHVALQTLSNPHGNTLVIMGLAAFIISVTSLIYCVMHIARVKYMNPASKMIWIIILVAFQPISFLLFYFLKIKREPARLETYPDIA